MERNYEKVGTLSEYNAENENDTEEDNDAHDRLDLASSSWRHTRDVLDKYI